MASGVESSPWPSQSIVVKPDGSISVEWNDADLTDDILERFVGEKLSELLKQLPAERACATECCVSLSGNRLQRPKPIAELLRSLRAASVHVTVLRLHKNKFDDTIVAALVDHMKSAAAASHPLMQLHLSNNGLSGVGVRDLVQGAHRSGGYPRQADPPPLSSLGSADAKRTALWLRLEQQQPQIDQPGELLERCASQGYPVCVLDSREGRVPATAVVQMHQYFVNGMPAKGNADEKQASKGFVSTGDSKGSKGSRFDEKGGKGAGKKGGKYGPETPESQAMVWLKKSREGDGAKEFEALWKEWCADYELSGKTKAERIESIIAFRAECESGSEHKQRGGPSSKVAKQKVAQRFPDYASQVAPPWHARAAAAVKQRIERAKLAGALDDAFRVDVEPGSDWQRLVYTGGRALKLGISRSAFEVGGSFMDEEGLSELCACCIGRASGQREGLAAACRALDLGHMFSVSEGEFEDDRSQASCLEAIFGELEEGPCADEASERAASRNAASKAVLDFVFLYGVSRSGAGVVADGSPVEEADPTDAEVAESPMHRKWCNRNEVDVVTTKHKTGGKAPGGSGKKGGKGLGKDEGSRPKGALRRDGGASSSKGGAWNAGVSWQTGGGDAWQQSGPWSGSSDGHGPPAGAGGLYKRHLCKFFEQGRCGKGSQCSFAHGPEELAR